MRKRIVMMVAGVAALLAGCGADPTATPTPPPTATATPRPAAAVTVTLQATRDSTLIEDIGGLYSNGGADYIFAGMTNRAEKRRALIAFDVAAQVPAGSTVTEVTLTLEMNKTRGPEHVISLHRVLAAWGEGNAVGAGIGQGAGDIAVEGDATWVFSVFETEAWEAPGGDFVSEASASTPVGDPASYVWGSSEEMVADVQGWLDDSATDHGWMLVGEEVGRKNAKRFGGRTAPDEAGRPALELVYVPPA